MSSVLDTGSRAARGNILGIFAGVLGIFLQGWLPVPQVRLLRDLLLGQGSEAV